MRSATILLAVALVLIATVQAYAFESVPALVWSGKEINAPKFSSLKNVLSQSSTAAVFLHHQVSATSSDIFIGL